MFLRHIWDLFSHFLYYIVDRDIIFRVQLIFLES